MVLFVGIPVNFQTRKTVFPNVRDELGDDHQGLIEPLLFKVLTDLSASRLRYVPT